MAFLWTNNEIIDKMGKVEKIRRQSERWQSIVTAAI